MLSKNKPITFEMMYFRILLQDPSYFTSQTSITGQTIDIERIHTSNLNKATLPPNMEDAKCSQNRIERPEDRSPPK